MTEMEKLVQEAIAKIGDVDADRVTPDALLEQLGLDSLAAAEMLVELEIRLGRELPVDLLRRLDQAGSIRDIAAQLEANFGGAPSGA